MAEGQPQSLTKLYTPTVLALSVELAQYPINPTHPRRGYAKSRTCGSEVLLSVATTSDDRIEALGLQVTACAVGQASAALFGAQVAGQSLEDCTTMLGAMEDWLREDAPSTIMRRLELLEPARAYPARHEAMLLPWRAVIDALSSASGSR